MRLVNDGRSMGQLFRDLKDDATYLVREEMELAKAEVKENARAVMRDAALIVAGVVVGLLAAMALVAAMSVGATALWGSITPDAVAAWLGPLTVAVLLGVVAAILVRVGRDRLNREQIAPERTAASMKENKEWIREKFT